MKIKTSKDHRIGKTINTVVGAIKFDNNGIADVDLSDEQVQALFVRDPSLDIIIDSGIEKTGKKEEDLDTDPFTITPEYLDDNFRKQDLLDILKVSDLPHEEWKSLNKQDLIQYIISKKLAIE